MLESDELHLDHVDGGGPNEYRGLSHARCNLTGAARRRSAAAAARREIAAAMPRRRDPGPMRTDIEHFEWCECAARAQQFGAWPGRCW
jgi:hypothetical protein